MKFSGKFGTLYELFMRLGEILSDSDADKILQDRAGKQEEPGADGSRLFDWLWNRKDRWS